MKKTKIRWLSEPQKHDYPAAQSYLSLIFEPRMAKIFVAKLMRVPMVKFAAKDIFRASGLPMLGGNNSHVEKDRILITGKEAISPLLLYRDGARGKLIVADGYHRLCAVYTFDEDAMIPCQII